jgi:NADH-ubiquinone oxidoreductase chain 5
MYLAILALPILGSTISGFLGRKVGVTGAQLITTICVNVTAILAFFAFLEIGFNNLPVHIDLFTWIDSETLEIV